MPPRPPNSTLFPYTTLFRSVEKGYPDGDADLRLIDEDEEHHHGDRDAALRSGEPPEWPDARLGTVGRIEKTVGDPGDLPDRSEEHTSELQSHVNLVCRLLLE